nr:PREDICTED: solute carrier family 35 member F2 isoform X1 [Lepisosteus oculatus]
MEDKRGIKYSAVPVSFDFNKSNGLPKTSENSGCIHESSLLQKRMELQEQTTLPSAQRTSSESSFLSMFRKYKLKEVFTWNLLQTIVLGQWLSVLICGTAVTSQYLAQSFSVNTPMLQSFINYVLLFLTYTFALALRKGNENILQILKAKWWKYLLLGITDVEANYMVVKAYQFTTLTSIQLLDCFVIPVLMGLSWYFLKTRYRIVHYVGVGVCLLGVGAMVGADVLSGRDQGSSSDVLLGDCLVLIGAALYGVSNVCQEYTVKNLSRVEFLGMVGMFGTLLSGIQLAILEHREVAKINWTWQVGLLFAVYALCMFGLYSFMSIIIKMTSATAVNLSLLTADLFSLFLGIFLFHCQFSVLYVVALVVIMIGFVMYNSVPTYTLAAASEPAGPGIDNPASETEEDNKQEMAIEIPPAVMDTAAAQVTTDGPGT